MLRWGVAASWGIAVGRGGVLGRVAPAGRYVLHVPPLTSHPPPTHPLYSALVKERVAQEAALSSEIQSLQSALSDQEAARQVCVGWVVGLSRWTGRVSRPVSLPSDGTGCTSRGVARHCVCTQPSPTVDSKQLQR